MPKVYRSREGTITVVDSKTQLGTLGSETAPGPLLVPAGAKVLKAVITCFANDMGTGAGGTYFFAIENFGYDPGS